MGVKVSKLLYAYDKTDIALNTYSYLYMLLTLILWKNGLMSKTFEPQYLKKTLWFRPSFHPKDDHAKHKRG